MRRLFATTKSKGMIKMLQSLNIFGRREQAFAHATVNEMPVVLRMPGWSRGKTVTANRIVAALLWQHYGLDLLHPEVSNWLEQHAPDVKYAVAENRFVGGDDQGGCEFRVGPDGTIKVYISLQVDDRLREVSSHYVLKQTHHSIEPEKRLSRSPRFFKHYRLSESTARYLAYQN